MPVSRSGRMKFNLLGKAVKRREPQYVVYVRHGDKWYLNDFDDHVNTAWWTKSVSAAYTFSDEEQVIDFCEMFLRNRDYNIEEIV